MKLTNRYKAREVMGELLLIPDGAEICNFNGVKSLNGSGKFIFRLLESGKSRDEIISALSEEYECESVDVEADVDEFLNMLVDEGIAE